MSGAACNPEYLFSNSSQCVHVCMCVYVCEKEENGLRNSQNPRLPFGNLQSERRDMSRCNGERTYDGWYRDTVIFVSKIPFPFQKL